MPPRNSVFQSRGSIAIANQGLAAAGASTLNSTANPMQTLQGLYSLPASDFHDITTGYNGLSAGTIVSFTVRAVNASGAGPVAAASVTVSAAQSEQVTGPSLPDTGTGQLATSVVAAGVLLALGVPLTLANSGRGRRNRPERQ